MKRTFFVVIIAFLFMQCEKDIVLSDEMKKETISFKSSADDLDITADTYIKETNSKFILLCHQAGFSRGEYINTAPTFVSKGYNCMAIDQRSGGTVNDVVNETHVKAVQKGLATNYLSAQPDISAAIDKAYKLNGNKPIFILGSSYSSSWAIILSKNNPKIKAVIIFSPRENLSGYNITNELAGYTKPVFATSAKSETNTTANMVSKIDDQYLTHFKSQKTGIHGARCLWDTTEGSGEYWIALEDFLGKN